MSCRFPGADTAEQFWINLRDGVELITFCPAPSALADAHDYVGASAALRDIDRFDAAFFGITPHEASLIDPQQRLFLECAWEALEDAGYDPAGYGKPIGVYAGCALNTYLINCLYPAYGYSAPRTFLDSAIDLQVLLSNASAFLPMRVAYKLDLTGPSVNVQTACSTGLVAVHHACRSLLAGDCDMALAGAAAISVPSAKGYRYQEGMILSRDGHCRAFDARATGTVFGDGVGVVVLKLLRRAIDDGDAVDAVIRGSAVNNDGAAKVSFSAPSVGGQAAVIKDALALADTDPATIGYVEAHGTGTPLGDPVEIAALARAFVESTASTAPLAPASCAIGSVKTNIGHLAEAAGVSGLVKVVLALRHRAIPPSLHYLEANPRIDFARSPFYVSSRLSEWPTSHGPRRAGVSSFGMGGTNAHVVLQEAPPTPAVGKTAAQAPQLLALSARSDATLRALAQRYSEYLDRHPQVSLGDLCFTASTGRRHFQHRLATVASSTAELQATLAAFATGVSTSPTTEATPPRIAFLFSGQGSQYTEMGRHLYESQPAVRRTLARADAILGTRFGAGSLADTEHAQPALFALEYALATMWESWGVRPYAVMGHSLGEYVAACLAGVFTFEDGLRLVAERGRLMQQTPAGSLLAASTTVDVIDVVIRESNQPVWIAAVNGPEQVVVSGAVGAMRAFADALARRGIVARTLPVSRAFHTPLMEPILGALENSVRMATPAPPRLKLVSNVTGGLVGDEMSDPAHWSAHARHPVQFAAGMETLRSLGVDAFLEIGPGRSLITMGRATLPNHAGPWLATLAGPQKHVPGCGQPELQECLSSLGTLYMHGVPVDWQAVHGDRRRQRIHLPTYPFERTRHWIEAPEVAAQPPSTPADAIRERVEPLLRHLFNESDATRYAEGVAQLDGQVASIVVEAFRELGWTFPRGERFSTSALATRLGVGNARWLDRLLAILEEDGVLCVVETPEPAGHDRHWRVVRPPELSDLEPDHADRRAPLLAFEAALLHRCGANLVHALRGTGNPLETLFPAGDLSGLASFYRHAPPLRAMNLGVQEAVRVLIEQAPAHQRLRVLEIGAGTGATTAAILPHLPAQRCRYVFTDVSPAFLAHGQSAFTTYPFVDYRLLDIERPAYGQGYEPRSYDVVIAGNVLHATRSLAESLRHTADLVAPGGALVLIEGSAPVRWIDLTFGCTPGWWRFTDHDVRPLHPLVSGQTWRALLEANGFGGVKIVDSRTCGDAGGALPQVLILARRSTAADRSPRERPSGLFHRVADVIRETLRLDDHAAQAITSDRPLIELGLDSLASLELRSRLQADLGRPLPLTLFYERPTLARLVDYLNGPAVSDTATGGDPIVDVVPLQSKGSVPPFFCVPGILGDVSQYQQLTRRLGDARPIYALQPPGVRAGTSPLDMVTAIATRSIQAMRTVQAVGPYALGGHSFGALVACEITRQLIDHGQHVSQLVILDIHADAGLSRHHLMDLDDTRSLGVVVRLFERTLGRTMTIDPSGEAEHPRVRLERAVRGLNAAGLPLTADDVQRFLNLFRASMRAMSGYRPPPLGSVPITFFRASQRHVDDDFLPDDDATVADPTWGWARLSSQCSEPIIVPGDHYTMMVEPNVGVLARDLAALWLVTSSTGHGT
jgi:acyl transferase domain-containing protein/thioesterase domain-containing protein/SAM-dependent methyltransferase/acyl carrier protein